MKIFTKKTILFFATLFVSLISQAQTVELVDKYSNVDKISLAKDASGNIYTSGILSGSTIIGSFTVTTSNYNDLVISKTDPSGNIVWAKKAGMMGGQFGFFQKNTIYTDASGIYVSGQFKGTSTFVTTTATTTINSGGTNVSAPYLLKIDLSGNLLWIKQLNIVFVSGICSDASGNILATGGFTGTVTNGSITVTATGPQDIFVAKLDANGNFIWFNKMGGTGSNSAFGIALDGTGNIYVCGSFQLSCAFNTYTLTSTSASYYSGFITKLNTSGAVLWAKQFGGALKDRITALAINSAGTIYFGGEYSPPSTFGTFTLTSGSVCNGQIDAAGSVIWVNQFGTSSSGDYSYLTSIDSDPAGNIYTTGDFTGTAAFGTTTLTSQFSIRDVFISKANSAGNFLWVQQFGGAAQHNAFSASIIESSGKIYASGSFEGTASIDSFSVTSPSNAIVNGYLIKLSSTLLGIREYQNTLDLMVYPNPVKDKLVIESKEFNQNIQISVTDVLGKEMLNKNFANLKTESIDVSMLLPGVYFLRVNSDGKSGVVKVVKE